MCASRASGCSARPKISVICSNGIAVEERRLSRAALETLAIIAYHQPVTRAEIEEIRGVTTSAGTLDILMEAGWIRPRGRRRAPGKPLTYGTTDSFLAHFGLDNVKDLPGLADLKAQGLLDGHLPPGLTVPDPTVAASLMPWTSCRSKKSPRTTTKASSNSTRKPTATTRARASRAEAERRMATCPRTIPRISLTEIVDFCGASQAAA